MPGIVAALSSLLLATGLYHAEGAFADQQVLKSERECPSTPYSAHLFNQDPLVIYLENFLLPEEAKHLQKVSDGTFTQSEIADEHGTQMNATTRSSRSTSLASDPIVRCIEDRAASFQGFEVQRSQLEPVQLVRYGVDDTYRTHTDWFEAESQITDEYGGNRYSSFFVYVAAENVTGGGTNFPLLDAPKDERWCKFVDCYEPWDAGVTFRPIPGNAVFWLNLHKEGMGNRATVHAGLPPTSGVKLGMNIWTRQRPLSDKHRGAQNV